MVMTKRTHSLDPRFPSFRTPIARTYCGIAVAGAKTLTEGTIWTRMNVHTEISIVDANPSCARCRDNAALAARRAPTMAGLPWTIAPWGDGSRPDLVNILSDSLEVVIARDLLPETARIIVDAVHGRFGVK